MVDLFALGLHVGMYLEVDRTMFLRAFFSELKIGCMVLRVMWEPDFF